MPTSSNEEVNLTECDTDARGTDGLSPTDSRVAEQRDTATKLPRERGLCDVCKSLDLTVDKFQSGTRRSPQYGRRPNRTTASSATFLPERSNARHRLGTFQEISARRKQCPFCDLVTRSVREPAKRDGHPVSVAGPSAENATCFLTWEIDGRSAKQTGGQASARTRRIHLQWDDTSLEDAYLVLMTPNRSNLINTDAQDIWRKEDHFLARDILPDVNKQTLIRSWLEECLRKHKSLCTHTAQERADFAKVTRESYFGVIDVVNMQLTALPLAGQMNSPLRSEQRSGIETSDDLGSSAPGQEHEESSALEPYVALSYVWGGPIAQKTTLQNILTRRFPGGLEEDLKKMPKVIQNAVSLVRRLGYRYLWVDSICIVQNSSRSWRLNSSAMNQIYGNAELTICAADGQDATAGLVALDPSQMSTQQIIAECGPGVRLMVSWLAEASIRKTKWNERAWTFQERLLSRRCLIFTEGRVIFQCRSATMSEDIVASPESAGGSSRWSLDLVRSPLKLLDALDRRPFWFYMRSVELYSDRRLTEPGDILAAFNGVSNLMEKAFRSPFVFGLPSSHFDLALLWIPSRTPKVRQTRSSHNQGDETRQFPTWSWCGWQDTKMTYSEHDMIEDCLDDVHAWLTNHTWIQWHIRDGRGRLRPLWDSAWTQRCEDSEPCWKGYTALGDTLSSLRRALEHSSNSTEGAFSEARSHVVSPPPPPPPQSDWDDGPRKGNRGSYITAKPIDKDGPLHVSEIPPRIPRNPRDIAYNEPTYGAYNEGTYGAYNEGTYRGNPFTRPERPPHTREVYRTIKPNSPLIQSVNGYENSKLGGSDNATEEDSYGRKIPAHAQNQSTEFSRVIPESPFRVNKAPYLTESYKEIPEPPFKVNTTSSETDRNTAESDSPILQFWTHSVVLRVVPTGDFDSNFPANKLCRCNVVDASGDWCGTVLLDSMWAKQQAKLYGDNWNSYRYEFLALSEAKRFTLEECETWTYYVPKERDQSEWDLYYVLLVQKQNAIWRRVALGKVFMAAFDNGLEGPSDWKEIVLG